MNRQGKKPYSSWKLVVCSLALTIAWIPLTGMGQTSRVADPGPRHLILMIGDGMGFGQVQAASLYATGQEGRLFLESLPVSGRMTTYSIDPEDPDSQVVTDSAAAATAMATGQKVVNGVICKRTPGDGAELETVLEKYAKAGRRTGLVTTTYITRPNPAYSSIDALPHLTEMTLSALAVLEAGGEGFFLMVEGGRIDHACHSNDLPRCIVETLEFDRAVWAVIEWAQGRDDVLVIVTADHECGGLKVLQSNGKGRWPDASWQHKHHTGQAVPVYAWGQGAELFVGEIDNTELVERIAKAAALVAVGQP